MSKKKTTQRKNETLRELEEIRMRKDLTEAEEMIVGQQIAEQREREANGGMLGESYAHNMTPEEEAEANRLVDEAIEADRLAAEGR